MNKSAENMVELMELFDRVAKLEKEIDQLNKRIEEVKSRSGLQALGTAILWGLQDES